MKRPLLVLFFLTALGIWLLYPRRYSPDPIFPQGQYYQVTADGDASEISRRGDALSLVLTNCTLFYEGQRFSCSRLLVSLPDECHSLSVIRCGNRLRIAGSLSSFQPARNPGNFDAHSYYKARRISYRIYAKSAVMLDTHTDVFADGIRRLSWLLSSQLEQIEASPAYSSIMKALLLGDRSALDEDVANRYETGGILHILSVSGLHVSLLGGAVLTLGRRLHLPPRLCCLAAAGLIFLYWQLCGAGLSSGRAAVMFACLCLAPLAGRTYDSLSALSLAGLFFLFDSPLRLFQSGFQLSFTAVFGIRLVAPALAPVISSEPKNTLEPTAQSLAVQKRKRFLQRLLAALVFHLSLQLTLLPVTLYHFYRYPLYGILLNLIVLPLTAPLFLCGALSLLLSFLWMPLSIVPAFFCRLILWFYDTVCTLAAAWPGASCILGRPSPRRIFLYYLLLAVFCLAASHKKEPVSADSLQNQKKRRSPALLLPYFFVRFPALFSSLLLVPLLLCRLPGQTLTVTFLDTGQGDCAFLQTPQGTSLLIDGGSSDLSDAASSRLAPFLEAQGIDLIDYVFISHTDADHVNAVTAWLESGGSIGTLILPRLSGSLAEEASYQEFQSTARRFQIPLLFFHLGQTWRQGDLSLLCLAPAGQEEADGRYSSLNAASLVLLAEYQGIRLLFTGDCEKDGEELLLKTLKEQNLTCHILKAGHHGSNAATGSSLLAWLSPDAVIVSCGIQNRYRHPHPDMLERVKKQGVPCYVTAQCGAVIVTVQNGRASLRTMLPAAP